MALHACRTAGDGRASLHWLARLITGGRRRCDPFAAGMPDTKDAANPFFAGWMVAWSRKLFIARVIGSVRLELEASLRRTRAQSLDGPPEPRLDYVAWERALPAIDLFPRCAVLLTVVEKFSLEDAAILLNADRNLVAGAAAIGLAELARTLEYKYAAHALAA